MSNWPVDLAAPLIGPFEAAFDRAGKIGRALESLGPVGDRDCVVVDATDGPVRRSMVALGARIVDAPMASPFALPVADASADCVIGLWSAFRGPVLAEIAEAERVLRVGGRLLVVHDYGRDDVSRIRGDRPEYGAWTRKNGPFLTGGFRIRVVHCFWDFASPEATTAFLTDAFGAAGSTVAATLKRPRLSYNVAIYHRSKPAS
ncbi:MAG TPA: hypothetical protein VF484_11385 [Candidatus Limnocylindrales bacterium]